MDNRKHIVIVGATSAMAEHCARLWVQEEPVQLTLIGRNPKRLERTAEDLAVRAPQASIKTMLADFLDPAAIETTVEKITAHDKIDIVLIAHGTLPEQGECQSDLNACQDALTINGVSPALFAEAFARPMASTNHGTIAIISSVAGDRGRQSNYTYGAAKALTSCYAAGLQHRFAGTRIKVVLVKPGPTDTPMTAHLKGQGMPLAPVEQVAKDIVRAVNKGKSVTYTPKLWKLIMLVIRNLPRAIFDKVRI